MAPVPEPQASQTFTGSEPEWMFEASRGLPACNDVVARDDELARQDRARARAAGATNIGTLKLLSARASLGTLRYPSQLSWPGRLTTMTEADSRKTRQPDEHNRSLATVPAGPKPADTSPDGDNVTELREALRAAERGYRGYLAELSQGDVEPVEDWSTWYAEYLLGLR
jgi:hypothetical protein